MGIYVKSDIDDEPTQGLHRLGTLEYFQVGRRVLLASVSSVLQ
jgi:hypothetical protein